MRRLVPIESRRPKLKWRYWSTLRGEWRGVCVGCLSFICLGATVFLLSNAAVPECDGLIFFFYDLSLFARLCFPYYTARVFELTRGRFSLTLGVSPDEKYNTTLNVWASFREITESTTPPDHALACNAKLTSWQEKKTVFDQSFSFIKKQHLISIFSENPAFRARAQFVRQYAVFLQCVASLCSFVSIFRRLKIRTFKKPNNRKNFLAVRPPPRTPVLPSTTTLVNDIWLQNLLLLDIWM